MRLGTDNNWYSTVTISVKYVHIPWLSSLSGLEDNQVDPHHVAQHHPPYAPRSSRYGSEPPSVEDDVDIWRYAILELHARNDDDDIPCYIKQQEAADKGQ